MDYSTGKITFIFLVAAGLSSLAAVFIAWRYRLAMRTLMSAPGGAGITAAPAVAAVPSEPARAVSLADNRRAAWAVTGGLVLLSMLMALSAAAMELRLVLGYPITPGRLLLLALIHMWPVVPALALLLRWSRLRLLGALALWFAASAFITMWRSNELQTWAGVLLYLLLEIGPPLVLMTLVCLGNATRAVAPWLFPAMTLLVWASIAGLDLLSAMVERQSPWLTNLPAALGAETVFVFFMLAPWLLAWWPARQLGRWIAAMHARKVFTELGVLFSSVWGMQFLYMSLSAASELGLKGAVMLLPLAWIPVAAWALRGVKGGPVGAPTLLVLRVFQRDAQVQRLFGAVIERWRLSGNTVLIAGTDLVERTLDGEDIFRFISGRLRERFILSPADVPARLAAFDMARDLDGRYRINECYCHDSTWQVALAALVQRSDVVLMDLRSFQARHQGCRHELGVLARSARIRRVVLLTDGSTDVSAAKEAAAGAPDDRFVWIDASSIDALKRREVLSCLFTAEAPKAAAPPA